jgi:hypothetical protein
MASIFNSIRLKRPKRNVFNLSYENKLTMNMGELVPIMCMPIVPGDKFRVNTEALVRLAPLVAPMMHRVNVYTHYFFVPNRLVWTEWEDFITKGIDGEDNPVFPFLDVSDSYTVVSDEPLFRSLFTDSSLWDYLGLPTLSGVGSKSYNVPNGVTLPNGFKVSQLPFRAYQLIIYIKTSLTTINRNSNFGATLKPRKSRCEIIFFPSTTTKSKKTLILTRYQSSTGANRNINSLS